MTNLPPPSTRLPGAPPPPILPHPYSAPRDPNIYPRLPSSKDEDTSAMPESDHGRQPPRDDYRQRPPSPTGQSKDEPPPRLRQTQEGRREQAPLQSSKRVSRAPVGDGHKENSREERHIRASPEERRLSKFSLDDRQVTPASWDRPRDPAPTPKPLALPASLPPKPVAALEGLSMPQSTSSRSGRGRRSQQHPTDEGNSQSTGWGLTPRGDGGREKDRERNRWGPAPEYQGPSLLARMSSNDSFVGEVMEIQERGGEVQRKRARTKKYQGV
ncbi:hypothetical protein BJV78DRAFT_205477 [Lactifluus subvellereus]|nr:hypothetical protein BJV78DRAFT_205477 [Lactifluus subvellereus]